MSNHKDEQEPWWNDGNKVGGLVATILVLCVAIILVSVAVRISVVIWP